MRLARPIRLLRSTRARCCSSSDAPLPEVPEEVLCTHSEDGRFATLTINRPKAHNALSPEVLEGFRTHLDSLRKECDSRDGLRAVFLRANGQTFCAGGDLKHMLSTGDFDYEENKAEAMALSDVFAQIRHFPRPMVGLVNGPAYGGGVGIISCLDMSFATSNSVFALSEVTLGVIPATISPFVITRIGESAANRYFLTAERFDADEAKRIGLINGVVADASKLDEEQERLQKAFLRCSPEALAGSKQLIQGVINKPIDTSLREWTAECLADVRDSADGKEGMSAFVEKRKPAWMT